MNIDTEYRGYINGLDFVLSVPAIIPVNTSPIPAVAIPGLPVELIHTSPFGIAIIVGAPLDTRVTSCCFANSSAAEIPSNANVCMGRSC